MVLQNLFFITQPLVMIQKNMSTKTYSGFWIRVWTNKFKLDIYANIWIVWFPCSHPASLASSGLILGKIVHFCVRTKTSAVGHLLTPALVLDTIATFKFLTYNCSKHSRIVQIHSTGDMLWSIDILASMVGARWPNSFQPRLIWPRWLGGPWWCPYHHQSIIITSCWLHPCEW